MRGTFAISRPSRRSTTTQHNTQHFTTYRKKSSCVSNDLMPILGITTVYSGIGGATSAVSSNPLQ